MIKHVLRPSTCWKKSSSNDTFCSSLWLRLQNVKNVTHLRGLPFNPSMNWIVLFWEKTVSAMLFIIVILTFFKSDLQITLFQFLFIIRFLIERRGSWKYRTRRIRSTEFMILKNLIQIWREFSAVFDLCLNWISFTLYSDTVSLPMSITNEFCF